MREIAEPEPGDTRELFQLAEPEVSQQEIFDSTEALRAVDYLQLPIRHLPEEDERYGQAHDHRLQELRPPLRLPGELTLILGDDVLTRTHLICQNLHRVLGDKEFDSLRLLCYLLLSGVDFIRRISVAAVQHGNHHLSAPFPVRPHLF